MSSFLKNATQLRQQSQGFQYVQSASKTAVRGDRLVNTRLVLKTESYQRKIRKRRSFDPDVNCKKRTTLRLITNSFESYTRNRVFVILFYIHL